MTILEILEAHTGRTFDRDGMYVCQCGYYIGTNKGKTERHRAHVAEVLDKHMQEREAAAKDEHRKEWADHISEWHATVGAPICHVDAVVQALRSDHVPFGKETTNGR